MEYVNNTIEKQISTDVDALKYKAIKEFDCLIELMKKGVHPDYQNILEIISLIDIYSTLDYKREYYKEFYLNGITSEN